MNQLRQLKAGNSKSQLVRAILTYQRALAYYASDEHWTGSYEGKFTWNDSRPPTEVAKIVLGLTSEVKPATIGPIRPVTGQKSQPTTEDK